MIQSTGRRSTVKENKEPLKVVNDIIHLCAYRSHLLRRGVETARPLPPLSKPEIDQHAPGRSGVAGAGGV